MFLKLTVTLNSFELQKDSKSRDSNKRESTVKPFYFDLNFEESTTFRSKPLRAKYQLLLKKSRFIQTSKQSLFQKCSKIRTRDFEGNNGIPFKIPYQNSLANLVCRLPVLLFFLDALSIYIIGNYKNICSTRLDTPLFSFFFR